MSVSADDDGAFLSRAAVGSRELRLCLALTGISAAVLVACIPYVRAPMPPSPAFVAVYNAVSILNDLTTAIILCQFILRHVHCCCWQAGICLPH